MRNNWNICIWCLFGNLIWWSPGTTLAWGWTTTVPLVVPLVVMFMFLFRLGVGYITWYCFSLSVTYILSTMIKWSKLMPELSRKKLQNLVMGCTSCKSLLLFSDLKIYLHIPVHPQNYWNICFITRPILWKIQYKRRKKLKVVNQIQNMRRIK